MKRGDKLKIVGHTKTPYSSQARPVVERELDDGAIAHGVLLDPAELKGRELPAGSEVIHCRKTAKDRYLVTKVEHPGPSRATTAAYRDGWDNIFGAPKRGEDLN